MEEEGDKPAIWLIDNTLPGGRSINLQLVEEGASKWCLPDLEKMGTAAKKGGFVETDEEPGGVSRGSLMTELEGLLEVQTALVNLMLESSLKTELMEKLLEAKKHLMVDFSKSNLDSNCLVKGDVDVPRNEEEMKRIIDADLGIEEPELESCAGEAFEEMIMLMVHANTNTCTNTITKTRTNSNAHTHTNINMDRIKDTLKSCAGVVLM